MTMSDEQLHDVIRSYIDERCRPIEVELAKLGRKTHTDSDSLHNHLREVDESQAGLADAAANLTRDVTKLFARANTTERMTDHEVLLEMHKEGQRAAKVVAYERQRADEASRLSRATLAGGRYLEIDPETEAKLKKEGVEEHYEELRTAWPPLNAQMKDDGTGTAEGVHLRLDGLVSGAESWLTDEPIGNDVKRQMVWAIRRAHRLGVESITKGG